VKIVGIDSLQIENPITNFSRIKSKLSQKTQKLLEEAINNLSHKVLLEKKGDIVFILENLTGLEGLNRKLKKSKGILICLPIKFDNELYTDNSITRAVALVMKGGYGE
jgi:kynurenine formamidase